MCDVHAAYRPSQRMLEQRLLRIRSLLPAAGLREGGCRRIARVLGLGAYQRRDTQPRAALPAPGPRRGPCVSGPGIAARAQRPAESVAPARRGSGQGVLGGAPEDAKSALEFLSARCTIPPLSSTAPARKTRCGRVLRSCGFWLRSPRRPLSCTEDDNTSPRTRCAVSIEVLLPCTEAAGVADAMIEARLFI